MLLTLIISVPAEVLFLNWLHTIWKGSIRLTTPMLFALGMVFVFGLGGLTGLFLGDISTDLYLHDTMFVVGHFHFTMAAALVPGSFAAIYFWFPKMFGPQMNERLGKVHFWFTSLGYHRSSSAASSSSATPGSSGASTIRTSTRSSSTCTAQHVDQLRRLRARAGQLVFVVNFFRSVFAAASKPGEEPVGDRHARVETPPRRPRTTTSNASPRWSAGRTSSRTPVVKKLLGRDWLGQTEPEPGAAAAAEAGGPGAFRSAGATSPSPGPPGPGRGKRRPPSSAWWSSWPRGPCCSPASSSPTGWSGATRADWPPRDLPRLPLLLPGPQHAGGRLRAACALARAREGVARGRPRPVAALLRWPRCWGPTSSASRPRSGPRSGNQGLRLDGGPYPSVFYALTGLHAAHVLVGLLALGWLALRAARGALGPTHRTPLRLWTMYWHFVGAIWLILFVTVYVA